MTDRDLRADLLKHLKAPCPQRNWDSFEADNYSEERADLIRRLLSDERTARLRDLD